MFRNNSKYYNTFFLALIVLVTLIAYWPGFFAGFTNFDDNRYVTENPMVWGLDSKHITNIFTSYYDGHYHPFTMLSLAVDFSLVGMKPWLFHFVNIIFHLINTILVFVFIKKLVGNERKIFAVITAFLFGIHSFHVESVVWIAERKDVLFGFFFLFSLIFYLDFLKKRKAVFYILALLFFIFSCLSKGQAVALAPALVLIDYFVGRKLLEKKLILEKLPFFILALVFGYIAMKAHATFPYISKESFPLYDRLVYACYAFFLYIGKTIFPFGLSAYYPYPETSPTVWYLIFPVLLAGLIFLLFKLLKRNRIIVFGTVFFAINIVLVLKIFEVHLQTGKFIIADRYSYIPSIGLFLIIAYCIDFLARKNAGKKFLIYSFLGVYLLVLTVITHKRAEVWNNSISLWNNVVSQYPELSWAYGKRALAKANLGNFRGAFDDNTIAIKLEPDDPHAWNNRGKLRAQTAISVKLPHDALTDTLREAKKDLDMAVKTGPEFFEAYANRGLINFYLGDLEAGLKDLNKAVEIMPTYAVSFYNRGLVHSALGNYKQAAEDFSECLKLNPRLSQALYYRSLAYLKNNEPELAIADLDALLLENPKNIPALFGRSSAFEQKGNLSEAIQDINSIIKIQNNIPDAYFTRANLIMKKGAIPGAIADYKKSLELNPGFTQAWVNLGIAFYETDSVKSACMCLDRAERLGADVNNLRNNWNCSK